VRDQVIVHGDLGRGPQRGPAGNGSQPQRLITPICSGIGSTPMRPRSSAATPGQKGAGTLSASTNATASV
jgi:hypothetical protein